MWPNMLASGVGQLPARGVRGTTLMTRKMDMQIAALRYYSEYIIHFVLVGINYCTVRFDGFWYPIGRFGPNPSRIPHSFRGLFDHSSASGNKSSTCKVYLLELILMYRYNTFAQGSNIDSTVHLCIDTIGRIPCGLVFCGLTCGRGGGR